MKLKHKVLGWKQAERVDMKKVLSDSNGMEQWTRKLVVEGLYDVNLVKAVNCRVIPVAA